MVHLDPDSKKHYRKFSAGMKKKLGIAHVLMEYPELILLDEPFDNIDEETVEELREIFLQYQKEHNATIVMTSHHKEDIEKMCGRIMKIEKKTVVY